MYLIEAELRVAQWEDWAQGMSDYVGHHYFDEEFTNNAIELRDYFWNKYKSFYKDLDELEEYLKDAVRSELRYRHRRQFK